MGMDLRRPFEPGLGTLVGHSTVSTANNNTVGGMNKGVGHWASDLILLVSDRNSNSNIATEEQERMNEIIQKNGSNRSETKAIFAHQGMFYCTCWWYSLCHLEY